MRKNVLLCVFFISMLILVTGCTSSSNNQVVVYDTTEYVEGVHQEDSLTAVVASIDYENDLVNLIDCRTGDEKQLIYNGGVSVYNQFGNDIGLDGLELGTVVDAIYYTDTFKLVEIAYSKAATVLSDVNKLSIDLEELKAVYKGTSCPIAEYLTAYDDGAKISALEINTEDLVTLNLYAGKLVSVQVQLGHGYVRLVNQRTYVGGMVEIGYDVIVPVTDDMLLAVREGEYTLRINKNGYGDTKTVTVQKDKEVVVDIFDISIPSGTVTFNIEPADSTLYVNGNKLENHVYTNTYGNYKFKVVAEGYEDFSGRFAIKDPTRIYDVVLKKKKDSTEQTTESTTEESTTDTSTTTATTGTTTETTRQTTEGEPISSEKSTDSTESTEEKKETNNNIVVSAPVGVDVYVDGEYIGLSPVTFKKVVGTHTITLHKKGYLIKSYTIQAKDDGKDDEHSFAELVPIK